MNYFSSGCFRAVSEQLPIAVSEQFPNCLSWIILEGGGKLIGAVFILMARVSLDS